MWTGIWLESDSLDGVAFKSQVKSNSNVNERKSDFG